jgi:hypothetical protein
MPRAVSVKDYDCISHQSSNSNVVKQQQYLPPIVLSINYGLPPIHDSKSVQPESRSNVLAQRQIQEN